MMFRTQSSEPEFLETEKGLFTPSGNWFRTTRRDLEQNYAAVFDHVTLGELIDQTESWLASHRTIAIWAVPFVLFVAPPWIASTVVLALFVGWRFLAPALGNRSLSRTFEVLERIPLQLALYITALSVFGASGSYTTLGVGIAWFLVLRWNVLEYILREPLDRMLERMYPLPIPDQMLRAVIFSYAIRLG